MTSRDHIAQRNPEGTPQKSYFRAGNWSMTPCFKARIGLDGLPWASATKRLECASSLDQGTEAPDDFAAGGLWRV
jgi:hypothetical protein